MMNLFSCKTAKNLPTVDKVDIQKYSGQWYEIARLPNSFEKGLECITATYNIKENGKIEVINKGYSIGENDKFKTAKGSAKIPNVIYPGRLKVTFFWPFYGNYYIIELDNDYKYVLVGSPSRKYLWVLARNKYLEESIYYTLLKTANKNGFNTKEMIKVNQDCNYK